MTLISKAKFWMHHPAVKAAPRTVLMRVFQWEIIKHMKQSIVCVPLNERVQVFVRPIKGRGTPGAIFIFREAYEKHLLIAIKQYVKPGSMVMDIGANIGYWTTMLADVVGPEGRVFAYEPSPENAVLLRAGAAASGVDAIVTLGLYALGATEDSMILFCPPDSGLSSLSQVTPEDRSVSVPVHCLDRVWQESGSPKISFVKMDVEGAEVLIFRGAVTFFQQCRPIVTCEVNDLRLRKLGSSRAELFEILREMGYRISVLGDPNRSIEEYSPFQDIIAFPDHVK
jgi:FkbM family methyltransferase